MNLVADIGNTRIKIGIFEKDNLILNKTFYINEFQKKYDELLNLKLKINSIIFTSVINEIDFFIEKFKKFTNNIIELSINLKLPFIIKYKTLETLGTDRIADVAGARFFYNSENVLIIDIGTAINYEIITSDNYYLGGHISPGLKMRFKALNVFTNKLPELDFKEDLSEIGNDTKSCIQTGVQYGIIYEINGFIEKYEKKFQDLKIILTGGDYKYFENKFKKKIFVQPNLSLYGLNYILNYNERFN